MMSAKLATAGLLQIKKILYKYYDVIISVHDATMRILSRGSNNIVNVSRDQSLLTLALCQGKLS